MIDGMINLKVHKKAVAFLLITTAYFLSSQPLLALPQGQEVVSGDAQFEQTDSNTLNITASNNSIIN